MNSLTSNKSKQSAHPSNRSNPNACIQSVISSIRNNLNHTPTAPMTINNLQPITKEAQEEIPALITWNSEDLEDIEYSFSIDSSSKDSNEEGEERKEDNKKKRRENRRGCKRRRRIDKERFSIYENSWIQVANIHINNFMKSIFSEWDSGTIQNALDDIKEKIEEMRRRSIMSIDLGIEWKMKLNKIYRSGMRDLLRIKNVVNKYSASWAN